MFATLLLLSLAAPAAAPESPAEVVAPGAMLEKLWGEGSFTEGGAMAEDGAILFSDIGDRILRFDPRTRAVTVFREPSGRANGLIFDPRGRLIAAEGANAGGGRRVSITERDGTVRTLADGYQRKRFNSPNDVAVDAKGRVYVSDPRYVGDEPRELDFEGVFRIDPDGSVHRLETTASKPNGLVVSPDGSTLYVADSGPGRGRRALLALDLSPDGLVSRPRVLHDFGEGRGVDGMTVTTDGRIVAAAGTGPKGGVHVFAPDGRALAFVPVPEPPTNVEFGGPDRRTLYITAGKSLYRVATTMTGYHPASSGRAAGAAPPRARSLFDGKTLDGWEATDFANAGAVKVVDGALVLAVGRPMTGITTTRRDLPTTDYELAYEAMRVEGEDFFAAATFPVGKSFLTLVNGGWGGNVTGLSSLNGSDASENDTGRFIKYENKTWYKFRVRVTAQVVRAWIDDKPVVAVDYRDLEVGTRIETRPNQPLGFATWESAGAIRKVEVRPLTPAEVAEANKVD